jgi:S-formylglutathione hydrolase FrmB
MSGSLRVQDRIDGKSANSGNQCAGMYGDPPEIVPEEQDLFFMLAKLCAEKVSLPQIFCCCGTADKPHIYGAYLNFVKHARSLGVTVRASERENAAHTWDYWDSMLPEALDWMMGSMQ